MKQAGQVLAGLMLLLAPVTQLRAQPPPDSEPVAESSADSAAVKQSEPDAAADPAAEPKAIAATESTGDESLIEEPPAPATQEPAVGSIPVTATTAPAATPQLAEDDRIVIDEIIVTATKREANVRDLPISVDAFSGERLEQIGATNLESITRFSPGVTVSPGLDAESATLIIRGVATDTFVNFFTRTFGLFYEDLSLVNPSILGPQPNLDPFDMFTVEILKGPQGTLFGGSALAGAVRYVANRPDFDNAYGSASASIGTLEKSEGLSHYYAAMWNQPLTNSLGLRLVASRRDTPGYVRDTRADRDDINSSRARQFRALLDWRISDDVNAEFHYVHRLTKQDDGNFASNDQRAEHDNRYLPDRTDSRSTALLGKLRWSFERADLYLIGTNLSKAYRQELDFSQFIGTSLVMRGLLGDLPVSSSQPSAEVRLVSTEASESKWRILDNWNYVAGSFYIFSAQKIKLDLVPEDTPATVRLAGDVDATENALFADVTRVFAERWELGLGGRLFKQTTAAVLDQTVFPAGDPGPGVVIGHEDDSVSETVFNPKLTLQYRHSKEFSVFASAIKGFRYAGVNQNPSQDPNVPLFFKSDSIWNYELGVRTSWFDRVLQLDVTGFYLIWKDLQVQQRDFTGGFAYTTNVGGARNIGLEAQLKTVLPGGFILALTAGLLDAKTTTFFDDFQGPAEEGSELPGSAPFTGSALLLYNHQFNTTEFNASLSYTYQTRNFNNLPHTYEHPALGLLNASTGLRLTHVPGKPQLSFTGTNLTNEFKPGVVFDTPNTMGMLVIFNAPRALVLTINFDIGRY